MATTTATSAATAAMTALASASATADPTASTASGRPPIYKVIGIVLAISSGLFIGSSFVLKKVGLLKANVKYNEEAGEGYGYLKNAWWWSGMTLMIVGEICNFVAYAFTDAILVTPLGALSVVITTILSAIFLKERLSFVGKVGCVMCILGSVVIVLNVPQQSAVDDIQQMQHFVIAPGFLTYAGVIIVGSVFIAFWAGPRYGKKSMMVYISICSLIGGLSVVATQGLGAAVVKQASGTPQFNQWFLYVLLVFVVCTLVTEIIFLNKALNIFNAAVVTPTYYVYFTSATIVSSAILFRGFHGSAVQIITVVMGFLQICAGVVLLQLSKSAKDVPDAAVFKGDLDQVRTVAEQADPESEPKADTIRGTAAFLRSFSGARRHREAEEVKRIHEERMEPIGENEVVEWDGLRRRKTILEPGETLLERRRSVHPPLGLTHFPTEDDHDGDDHMHNDDGQSGFFPNFRRRALSGFSMRSSPSARSARSGDRIPSIGMENASKSGGPHTVALTELNLTASRESPIGTEDTAYHRPRAQSSVHWDDDPHDGYPPPPPPHTARRQFSFQQVFRRPHSGSRASAQSIPSVSEIPEEHGGGAAGASSSQRVGTPPAAATVQGWRGRNAPSGRPSRGGRGGQVDGTDTTEEERLGLVKGDSNAVGGGRGRPSEDNGRRYSSSNESWTADDDVLDKEIRGEKGPFV